MSDTEGNHSIFNNTKPINSQSQSRNSSVNRKSTRITLSYRLKLTHLRLNPKHTSSLTIPNHHPGLLRYKLSYAFNPVLIPTPTRTTGLRMHGTARTAATLHPALGRRVEEGRIEEARIAAPLVFACRRGL